MIRFEQVSKVYPDGTTAVDGLSFEVREGELVTLVGPSGCGKTTTMMMVNRLLEPTSGRILVGGRDVSETDPVRLRRRIGYVIQQVGLFPHRTVLDNTATVPALLGWKRARARERAAELLDLVGLDPAVYGPRRPAQLSGGQRQRVGVARALAADPPVLLMDEPFGAVDPVTREKLQNEFLKLQATVRKTVLLVTHDIEEAVRMGDRIAVYGPGRIEQFDRPGAVLGAPATPYVAEFVGADRGLRRLSVTTIEPADLEQPPVVRLDEPAPGAARRLREEGARWAVVLNDRDEPHGWVSVSALEGAGAQRAVGSLARRMEAWVPLGAPLKRAFGELLQHDAGWVAVLDGARFAGVLTPAKLHEALRRSVGADARGVARGEVLFDSVADA
ncbi:ATP-binding cassette domain-containing protein [Streptomyces sp. NBC_01498]|uniref:ABC transporter ATP-binding protein n=1 Tax=Streptomyces sp. NBC_01498 TaxID=2975870 RepID=UPI002E7BED7C|nr:ATP-binding cassette domain-containing protein [Streptomyces sp. NBC_01498]WTL23336.1 ATP-binding cassette domain-containing protein [Streptomyces sp. NBC_01498]